MEQIKQFESEEVFDWKTEFPQLCDAKGNWQGFDVVIGNPPYLGEKGNKEIFRKIRKGNLASHYSRKMDLFYFFYHLGILLLKADAVLSYITTNYFLTSFGGKKLRQELKTNTTILKLLNLNNLTIFESAKGQHNMIVLLQKNLNENIKAKCAVVQSNENFNNNLTTIDTATYEIFQKDLYETENNYIRLQGNSNNSENAINRIFKKMMEQSVPLIDECDVNAGIVTGVDKITKNHIFNGLTDEANLNSGVFILSEQELRSLSLNENERKLVKPWFKNSDIQKYTTSEQASKFLIYATRDLELTDYPNIKQHLYQYKDVINHRSMERGEIQAALKMGKWWVVFCARDKTIFEGEKIVCPQRSKTNTFAYNNIAWFASADVSVITNPRNTNLKYILALLNSRLYYKWLYYKGKRKGELLELLYTPLTQIPIKIEPLYEPILCNWIEKIIESKKNNENISKYEEKIDTIVYKLFNLTDEEINIIKQ